MSLKQLDKSVRNTLRSGIAITSMAQCVTELIENSIDAGGTCIDIRVDASKCKVQVFDNGKGIDQTDLNIVGERYVTSKCHTIEDLDHNLQHLGYRGEALSSVINVSRSVEISSRHHLSQYTYSKVFRSGEAGGIIVPKNQRPSVGTTITVHDFFYNMPVRRKSLADNLELERIRKSVETIALVNPSMSFSLRNDLTGSSILQTHMTLSILTNFGILFGSDKVSGMKEVSIDHAGFKISGFISIDSHHNKSLQYIYINKHIIGKSPLHACVNKELNNSLLTKRIAHQRTESKWKDEPYHQELHSVRRHTDRFPMYILLIECPRSEYDISFEPAKTLVEFKHWDGILSGLTCLTRKFLELNNLGLNILPVNYKTQEDMPAQLKIKTISSVPSQEIGFSFKEKEFRNYNFEGPGSSVSTLQSRPVKRPRIAECTVSESELEPTLEVSQYACIDPLSTTDEKQSSVDIVATTEHGNKLNIIQPRSHCAGVRESSRRECIPLDIDSIVASRVGGIDNDATDSVNVSNAELKIVEDHCSHNYSASEILYESYPRGYPLNGPASIDSNIHPVLFPALHLSKPNILSHSMSHPLSSNSVSHHPCHLSSPSSLSSLLTASLIPFSQEANSLFITPYNVPTVSSLPTTLCPTSCNSKCYTSVQSPVRTRSLYDPRQNHLITDIAFASSLNKAHPLAYNRSDPNHPPLMCPTVSSKLVKLHRKGKQKMVPRAYQERTGMLNAAVLTPGSTLISCARSSESSLCLSSRDCFKPILHATPSDCCVSDPDHSRSIFTETESLVTAPKYTCRLDLQASLSSSLTLTPSQTGPSHTRSSTSSSPAVNKLHWTMKHAVSTPVSNETTSSGASTGSGRLHELVDKYKPIILTDTCSKWRDVEELSMVQSSGKKTRKTFETLLKEWQNPTFLGGQEDVADAGCNRTTQSQVKVHSIINRYKFTKEMFDKLMVVGQVDNKFIACLMSNGSNNVLGCNNLLVMIDQHAADERVRLEALTDDFYEELSVAPDRKVKMSKIHPPLVLSVRLCEVQLAKLFRHQLEKIGVIISVDSAGRLLISTLPSVFMERKMSEVKRGRPTVALNVLQEMIVDHLELLQATGGGCTTIPAAMMRVLSSQACHGAIKFGDPLTLNECKSLILSLSKCRLPFQCAHGRPALVPLIDLDILEKRYPSEQVMPFSISRLHQLHSNKDRQA